MSDRGMTAVLAYREDFFAWCDLHHGLLYNHVQLGGGVSSTGSVHSQTVEHKLLGHRKAIEVMFIIACRSRL